MSLDYDSNSWRIHGAPEKYWTEKATIKVPARFKTIIERTVSILEKSGQPPIINFANSNLNKLKYLLNKIENKENLIHVEPLAIYRGKHQIDGYEYEFYLAEKDFKVIMRYPFVIDKETLTVVLNKLGVKTKNNYKINLTCIYKWKFLKTEEWKDRYNRLMREKWGWNGSQYEKGKIKNKIIDNIESGKYSKEFTEIRKQIEANHLEKTVDYVLIPPMSSTLRLKYSKPSQIYYKNWGNSPIQARTKVRVPNADNPTYGH